MTIQSFLNQVKWALDDENLNLGAMSGVHYSSDKAHIMSMGKTALMWLARHAPVSMMDGSDETESSGMLYSYAASDANLVLDVTKGEVQLPGDYLKLSRVKVSGWSRAIRNVVDDTSEEYLMLGDAIATASADRPVAYIKDSNPKVMQLCPGPGNASDLEMTVVRMPSTTLTKMTISSALTDTLPCPPKLVTAWVYMTCYLMLVGWGDSRANAFFEVVKNELKIEG